MLLTLLHAMTHLDQNTKKTEHTMTLQFNQLLTTLAQAAYCITHNMEWEKKGTLVIFQ